MAQEIGAISGEVILLRRWHIIVNFGKVLQRIRAIIGEARSNWLVLMHMIHSFKEEGFYDSVVIVLEAVVRFAHRYSQLANLRLKLLLILSGKRIINYCRKLTDYTRRASP